MKYSVNTFHIYQGLYVRQKYILCISYNVYDNVENNVYNMPPRLIKIRYDDRFYN